MTTANTFSATCRTQITATADKNATEIIHGAANTPAFATSHGITAVRPHRTADDDKEAVAALVTQYVTGQISEVVFQVSLHRYLDPDDIRHLTMLNQIAHRNSLPYRRGDIT